MFQTLNLAQAAHRLGLGGLGVLAFPILAALVPGSDWGSALRGVGAVTALEIVQSLQELACPPLGSDEQPLSLTPELVRLDDVAAIPMMALPSQIVSAAPVHVTARRRLLRLRLKPALACQPSASHAPPPVQILETALQWERVTLHSSQADNAAALQTLTHNLNIFAMVPVVKVGRVPASTVMESGWTSV